MTQPDEFFPTGSANYSSLAAHAAKTETDWNTELEDNEINRWGDAGLLGGFAIKWTKLDAAKSAADYALAQLAVSNRPIKDLFDGASGAALSASWDTNTEGSGSGTIKQDGFGNAYWDKSGGNSRGELRRWNALQTATDVQVVSVVMPEKVQSPALGSNAYLRLLGRVVNTSTINTYVYAEMSSSSAEVGYVVSGSETVLDTASISLSDSDVWDFYIGFGGNDYRFLLQRNSVDVIDVTDSGPGSSKGSGYRSVGFHMHAAARNLNTSQTTPGTLAVFSADDN